MALNKIFITNVGGNYSFWHNPLKKVGADFLRLLRRQNVALNIYLVSDAVMRRLNKKYRRRDKSTNVLAFGLPDGFVFNPGEGKSLGEVYLSPDYIKKHGEDMLYLLAHGLLHLLGYDHGRKDDMIKMTAKEKFLMKKLSSNQ